MRKMTMVGGIICGALCCVLAFQMVVSAQQAKLQPPRVGVVAMWRMKTECTKVAAGLKALEKQVAAYQKEINDQNAAVKTAKNELDVTFLRKTSPEYMQLREDYLRKSADAQAKMQIANQMMKEQSIRVRDELLAEVDKAVTAIAQENGIDLVFKVEEEPVGGDPTDAADEYYDRYSQRNLIYYSSSIDITDMVIDRLNASNE